ncbi:hypothetical protein C0J52_17821 [Blattella germanica]|nr:hypothetical protein C0J52_17821 [Blattella germanica]
MNFLIINIPIFIIAYFIYFTSTVIHICLFQISDSFKTDCNLCVFRHINSQYNLCAEVFIPQYL